MKLKVLFTVVVLSLTSNSFAGLLVDPYIGIGQTKDTLDLAGASEESGSSTVIGSRLGYSFILLSAGIDYSMVKSSSDGDDIDSTNMSVFVGVDMPILVRAWAEYFVSSDFDVDNANVNGVSFKDGYGVGLGFTGLPFVSINLELDLLNYEVDLVGASKDYDYAVASTLLSVSLPLDL
ncbi:MAG: hypothetical protein HON90_02270 [Halobacteriovoraceae bacterium]|jgi:hypothetical protein|nr:hypothetical protein [Halobacteriovoraceae bacterium]